MSFRCLCLAAVCSIFCGTVVCGTLSAQPAKPASPNALKPAAADLVLEVDAVQLWQSRLLASYSRLLQPVHLEARQLFESHLGIDLTEVRWATLVLPRLDQRAGSADDGASFGPPWVVVLELGRPVDPASITSVLGPHWVEARLSSRRWLLDEASDMGVLVLGSQTIAIGHHEAARWYARQPEVVAFQQPRQPRAAQRSNCLQLEVRVDQLPKQLLQDLPPQAAPFAKLRRLTAGLTLEEQLSLQARLDFESPAAAGAAEDVLRMLVALARGELGKYEQQSRQLAVEQSDFATAFGGLVGLALVREGQNVLRHVRTRRDAQTLQLNAQVHADATAMIMICLSAVQAIGTQAEQSFERVSDQLER